MKIAIIGAAGMAGKAAYQEAVERGHEVVGIVRNEEKGRAVLGSDARLLVKDAFDLEKSDLSGFDVIINAFATAPDKAYLHVDLAAKLVALFRETSSPRLFFILGAGSLLDHNDRLFVETIKTIPGADAWISIPVNQYKQLEFLRQVDNVNWVGVSPSAQFVEGEKHTPVLGKTHLLTAADGKSHTTSGTMAVAILDEIEKPSVHQDRFTVSD
ncbi:NAD(P)H-binding protein [Gorillibacterium sp. CAU 1737]|uniref:NAD(P)-dependent oxidoreductase n=1 Tax=Gorillibacterium sp. CAU 1737 TaxID=3140362 RepID=UPI003260C62C